ncbi:MAG: thioredoxin family protein [Candidatus Riflebacteria bacterium]|nr:thioredoxin family protein [Candidatus Riflebacteria bacterium]
MNKVTVIKSAKAECKTCHEAHRVVLDALESGFQGRVTLEVLINDGNSEVKTYGIISTPVFAINKKIYSMGKPLLKEKVIAWILKEIGN